MELLAACEVAEDDVVKKVDGMQVWIADAIAQATLAERFSETGAGHLSELLVIEEDFDLSGDRIVWRH